MVQVRGIRNYATKKQGGVGSVRGKKTFKVNEKFRTVKEAKRFVKLLGREKGHPLQIIVKRKPKRRTYNPYGNFGNFGRFFK